MKVMFKLCRILCVYPKELWAAQIMGLMGVVLSCRGEAEKTRAFLRSFSKESVAGDLTHKVEGLRDSYRAMCYTLFHEQEVLASVFENNPSLWYSNSLAGLQNEVWGFLDNI